MSSLAPVRGEEPCGKAERMRIIHEILGEAQTSAVSRGPYTKLVGQEGPSYGFYVEVLIIANIGDEEEAIEIHGDARHIRAAMVEAIAAIDIAAEYYVDNGELDPNWADCAEQDDQDFTSSTEVQLADSSTIREFQRDYADVSDAKPLTIYELITGMGPKSVEALRAENARRSGSEAPVVDVENTAGSPDDASPFTRGLWELAQRNGVMTEPAPEPAPEPYHQDFGITATMIEALRAVACNAPLSDAQQREKHRAAGHGLCRFDHIVDRHVVTSAGEMVLAAWDAGRKIL